MLMDTSTPTIMTTATLMITRMITPTIITMAPGTCTPTVRWRAFALLSF